MKQILLHPNLFTCATLQRGPHLPPRDSCNRVSLTYHLKTIFQQEGMGPSLMAHKYTSSACATEAGGLLRTARAREWRMPCQAIINKTQKTQAEKLVFELFHLADIKKEFSLMRKHHGKTKSYFCHGQT